MKTLIIAFGLLIALSSAAQNVTAPQGYEAKENLRELGSTDGTGTVQTFDNRYEGVKGTPYVFEQFRQGEVFLYKAKKSKKQMLAAFPGQENQISSFIKSNRLDLKNEESLVKLLEFYDSL